MSWVVNSLTYEVKFNELEAAFKDSEPWSNKLCQKNILAEHYKSYQI